MEDNKPKNNNEIQVELSEEMAQGTYANLAVIRVVPGAPKAQVKSRVILTPDNAHRLYLALQDNLKKFEDMMASGRAVNTEAGKTANFQDFVPKGDA